MIINKDVFILTYIVLASVASLQVNTQDLKNINTWRIKRQDNRWLWGYVDTPATPSPNNFTFDRTAEKPNSSINPSDVSKNLNPCSQLHPKKPDFSAPGRRISEVMCYGYIWEIKNREDEPRRTQACHDYVRKHGGGIGFGVGGRDAKPGEFPHMGAVGWKGTSSEWVFKCGSTLISTKFMLTAAHCSKASSINTDIADPVPKIVRLGQTKISGFSGYTRVYTEDGEIIRIIVHPNYKSPYKYFDIALLELKKDIKFFGALQPACLWTKQDTSSLGTSVSMTGWGVKQAGSRTTSPELQVVDLDLIDSQSCNQLLQEQNPNFRHWFGLEDHQLCAGKLAGGADACQGDSGGPLQVRIPLPDTSQGYIYHVVGITSFGISCALPNVPGVYTRVSSFIDWIESVVWPNGV